MASSSPSTGARDDPTRAIHASCIVSLLSSLGTALAVDVPSHVAAYKAEVYARARSTHVATTLLARAWYADAAALVLLLVSVALCCGAALVLGALGSPAPAVGCLLLALLLLAYAAVHTGYAVRAYATTLLPPADADERAVVARHTAAALTSVGARLCGPLVMLMLACWESDTPPPPPRPVVDTPVPRPMAAMAPPTRTGTPAAGAATTGVPATDPAVDAPVAPTPTAAVAPPPAGAPILAPAGPAASRPPCASCGTHCARPQ